MNITVARFLLENNVYKDCGMVRIPTVYYDQIMDALKEQEAKCLTKAELDDLNENQFVWFEGRTGYLYCLQIIGICRDKTGVSNIQFNAPTSYVERSTNTYGKTYRIWTNKPTEEQSQAVKWE